LDPVCRRQRLRGQYHYQERNKSAARAQSHLPSSNAAIV
jgi:hypothetical protein